MMNPESSLIIASRKRLLLAAYIDYLLFASFWEIVWHFIGPDEGPLLLKIAFFILCELLAFWRIGSPGYHFLCIYTSEQTLKISQFKYNPTGELLLVKSEIYNNESKLTIFLGVLFILDGTKQFVRWTMWTPPIPYFGIEPTFIMSALISMASGVLFVSIGYLILRLKKIGFLTGVSTSIIYIISFVSSVPTFYKIIVKTNLITRCYKEK